ncbi:hypothetical protein [Trichloromonas acetexigens]|uniref:Toluene tolerance protein n=1 Tax=Trichloromonas acetexigens TaxID=38815 RepID=A0A550JHR9_9BACT|nr:hypothetical protein [Desulfuromonas acetexigens]TRO82734.1 toluene tolerance protein [Desulfuromonas acetexigens]
MIVISRSAYHSLIEQSQVIERDAYGEKVLVAPDGHYIKIFRTKKRLSTAAIRPYALRFQSNAEKLACLGIPTVQVCSVSYCPENRRHLVTYRPLPGETLRSALRTGEGQDDFLAAFARFLAKLHRRGIYFRSIHFGNVIIQPDSNEPGLIDIADMRIRRRPLGASARARNLRHFLRYREDVHALKAFGLARFLEIYLEDADLRGWQCLLFRRLAARTLSKGLQR